MFQPWIFRGVKMVFHLHSSERCRRNSSLSKGSYRLCPGEDGRRSSVGAVGTEGGEKNEDLWWKQWLSPIFGYPGYPYVHFISLYELMKTMGTYRVQLGKSQVEGLEFDSDTSFASKNKNPFIIEHWDSLWNPTGVPTTNSKHFNHLFFGILGEHRVLYDSTWNSTKPRQKLLQWLSIPSSQSFAALKKHKQRKVKIHSKHESPWGNVCPDDETWFLSRNSQSPIFFRSFFVLTDVWTSWYVPVGCGLAQV